MQHASKNTLPDIGPGHRTAGVEWARDDRAVAVVDASGQVVERFFIAHTAAGIRDLVCRLAKVGAHEVAIERPDGPVVEAPLKADMTVVVISPTSSSTSAPATARPTTRTIASTPSSSPTPSAPTGPDCVRSFPTARFR